MFDFANSHEFNFTQGDFDKVVKLMYAHAGIQLSEGKEELVYGRLARRIRTLGLSSFKEYLQAVQDESEEFKHFSNALTTNLTAFFREKHHFEYLTSTVIPDLLKRNAMTRRIRVWSAGCSSGEEPYSLAMTLAEAVPDSWNVKILATDLDTNMVEHGDLGVYDTSRVDGMPSAQVKRWFSQGSGSQDGKVRAKEKLREMITFLPLNLLKKWPMKGPFDFIFCRNVIIYFDHDTKTQLVKRYADMLPTHGHLFIGHSETLFKTCDDFELKGSTIYAKV